MQSSVPLQWRQTVGVATALCGHSYSRGRARCVAGVFSAVLKQLVWLLPTEDVICARCEHLTCRTAARCLRKTSN